MNATFPAIGLSPRANPQKRLAIVCQGCGGGGSVGQVALNHARFLASFFDVTLVSDSLPPAPMAGVRYVRVCSSNFRWLRRFGHVPRDISFCLAAARSVIEAAGGTGFDIVEFHSHPAALIAGTRVRRAIGSAIAMVTHGDIFDRPPGMYDGRLTAYYRYVTPRAYRVVDGVIALSPPMRDLAIRHGANGESVAVVPNGVDPSAIGLDASAVTAFPPPTRLELLYVGRLAVEKGVDDLLRAVALVAEAGIRVRLRVVGAGPMGSSLKEQARLAKLDSHVDFLGPCPRTDLARLYQSAHVICVPSLSDALPTVVMESMLCGRPLIGSHVGGIPFMIERDGGWTVPPGNPQALAARIGSIAQDPAMTEVAGSAARAIARRRFLWPIVAEELAKVLTCLAGPPAAGSVTRA